MATVLPAGLRHWQSELLKLRGTIVCGRAANAVRYKALPCNALHQWLCHTRSSVSNFPQAVEEDRLEAPSPLSLALLPALALHLSLIHI